MNTTPTFTIPGSVSVINEWRQTTKRDPRLVKSSQQRRTGTSTQLTISAFGSDFGLNFDHDTDVSKIEEGKYYLFTGDICSGSRGSFLRCNAFREISEEEAFDLARWETAGLVKRCDPSEDQNTGETTYRLHIAGQSVELQFYGVPSDIAGSLSVGDLVEASGTFAKQGQRMRYDIEALVMKQKPGKGKAPKQAKSKTEEPALIK